MQAAGQKFRFGEFELDTGSGELLRAGTRLHVQPQPFKLLVLLVSRAGQLVTREEIRHELWSNDTFVDFEQAVNFCIKQIRDVLKDQADRPAYIQTVPKRGYRFIAPVETGERKASSSEGTTVRLQKALWTNIAELRLAEERRRTRMRIAGVAVLIAILLAAAALVILQ